MTFLRNALLLFLCAVLLAALFIVLWAKELTARAMTSRAVNRVGGAMLRRLQHETAHAIAIWYLRCIPVQPTFAEFEEEFLK